MRGELYSSKSAQLDCPTWNQLNKKINKDERMRLDKGSGLKAENLNSMFSLIIAYLSLPSTKVWLREP